MEKYYSKEEAESSLCKQVFFQMDKVTLDIPEAGIKLPNGWSIVPMTHPASVSLTSVFLPCDNRKGIVLKVYTLCSVFCICLTLICKSIYALIPVNEAMESTYPLVLSCVTFHAQLMQTEVDSYVDSIPPSCQLELHFQKTEQPYERLSHQIKVSGFRGISTITITRDVDPGK